jgi:hypothetical protein
MEPTYNLAINNLTIKQFKDVSKYIMSLSPDGILDEKTTKALSEDEKIASPVVKAKRGRPPLTTVSDEEDNEFGTKELSEEGLEDDDETTDDSEEETLTFEEVKEALNRYGNKHPSEAKGILLSFNLKSTKELKEVKTKWEPVYRKVMAKLKLEKKSK